jgi:hypothetical protein
MTKFKVLSWNLSWGAMTANEDSKNDKSAKFLAYHKCAEITKYNKLHNSKIPTCLDNVINFLISDDYYIIGLQEVVNFTKLKRALKNNYHSISSKSGPATITTFYKKIFKYLDHYEGSIEHGRPYHVIFFYYLNNYFIVINLHNSHHCNKYQLETILSTGINRINIDILLNDFHIIAIGDFNDHGKYNYWLGLKPFRSLKSNINDTLKKAKIKSELKPPNTCCVGSKKLRETKGEDKYYGDYILVNSKLNLKLKLPNTNIFNYNANYYPTSDHLPIIGYIRIKND